LVSNLVGKSINKNRKGKVHGHLDNETEVWVEVIDSNLNNREILIKAAFLPLE